MSTTINVTVGGNGLLDQSRQQMQANRFGRLERDQDSKTEAQATEQQQNRQERIESIGRPVTSRRITPEPAAQRRGLEVVLEPGSDYTSALYTLPAKVKGARALNFVVQYDYSFPLQTSDYLQFVFLAGGGPAGTNALTLTRPIDNTTYYDAALTSFYLVDQNPIDGYAFDYSTAPATPYGLVDNQWKRLSSNKVFVDFAEWTLEGFVRAGDIDPGDTYQQQNSGASLGNTVARMGLSYSHEATSRRWQLGVYVFGIIQFVTYFPIGDIAFGSWNHLCAVKKGDVVSVYFNGNLMASDSVTSYYLDYAANELVSGYISASVSGSYLAGGSVTTGTIYTLPAFHGYRFTARARYTSSFTPPPFIA